MAATRILLIAGTRPNFIKIAPLYHTLKKNDSLQQLLCHTGQHYDKNMSSSFWDCLELPEPDFDLKITAGNVSDTIGKTIIGINNLLQDNPFDLVIVVGDVNATVAGAIAASQNGIKVMHVESGLRSFDRDMPEEINRIITDHISNFLMVSEPIGIQNLKNEGIDDSMVHYVGNIMIECLIRTEKNWRNLNLSEDIRKFTEKPFVAATFHRPENVDSAGNLKNLINIIKNIARDYRIVFPVHPRTRSRINQFGLHNELENANILCTEPIGYFEFLKLVSLSEFVITDSGGIQEETTHFNKPCFTIRKNTERPITISAGSNLLINLNDNNIPELITGHLKNIKSRKHNPIPLWDEKVSTRIAKVIHDSLR